MMIAPRLMLFLTCVFGMLAAGCATSAPAGPPRPSIPHQKFNIKDFGAVGDGTTMNTAAIQATIDTCNGSGGGMVIIPKGRFLTGPLLLCSNFNLHLDDGATIVMSDKPTDFLHPANGRHTYCFLADHCHDLAITGRGTIDGQGAQWWMNYRKAPDAPGPPPGSPPMPRPFMLALLSCQRVLVQDVTLTNSPSFHVVPSDCRDVTIERIHVLAPAKSPNTDGIDTSGSNYLIRNCTFDDGDDCIALKPFRLIGDENPICENYLVTDCTFLHGHGMSIGSQIPGGVRHLTVRNSTFQDTAIGIRLKANRIHGGTVEDANYENLTMKNVKLAILITSYYPRVPDHPELDTTQPVIATTPIWRHIRITNVTAEGSDVAGRIVGLPEMHIADVLLTNVHIAAHTGFQVVRADNIRFVNSQVTAEQGPALTAVDSQVEGLDSSAAK
jgi:polygalacturonase